MSAQPPERILLIDNDPDAIDLVARQTLQPMGYQVAVATDGGSAIKQAIQFQPHLILAYLNLPGLTGKDLLVAFNSQGINMPVIVTAEKGEEPKVIQAFRLGASDYLMRPFRDAEVVSCVERAMKQVREVRARQQLDEQLKRTNGELQRRIRELTTIFSVGRAVMSITDQRVLFEKIVEAVVTVAEADMGWLTLKDDASKSFLLVAHRHLPDAWGKKIGQPLDDGLSPLVSMSSETLSIHGDPLSKFKVSMLGKAVMVVPIKVQQETIGLLNVLRKTDRSFGQSEQTLMEAIADYASISMINARLFRALGQSVEAAQAGEKGKYELLQKMQGEIQGSLQSAVYPIDMVLDGKMGPLTDQQKQAIQTVQAAVKRVLMIASQQITQPTPNLKIK